jgi:hypothetical protein
MNEQSTGNARQCNKKGSVLIYADPFKSNLFIKIPYYNKNGTIKSATTFRILIIGLMAGPAVSL